MPGEEMLLIFVDSHSSRRALLLEYVIVCPKWVKPSLTFSRITQREAGSKRTETVSPLMAQFHYRRSFGDHRVVNSAYNSAISDHGSTDKLGYRRDPTDLCENCAIVLFFYHKGITDL
jgi:hypothetical protein